MGREGIPTGEGTSLRHDVADPHPSTEEHYQRVSDPRPKHTEGADIGPNSYVHSGDAPPRPGQKHVVDVTIVHLENGLMDGVRRFIAERSEPPRGKMSEDDAINVIVQDWLMAQGYMPLPGDAQGVTHALDAAAVPKR
jgi:hypothetical protein